MMVLKSCAWERVEDRVVIASNRAMNIELDDPGGEVEALLECLRAGVDTAADAAADLAAAGLSVGVDDVSAAISSLDELGLLEHAGATIHGRAKQRRDYSNLAFFDLFSGLDVTAEQYQQRLADAHVVQLGTGGLGSNVLQSLCGLGVGRLTLLDNDLVEPPNFARQFIYREDQIGSPKVERAAEWVRAYDSRTDVRAVSRWVSTPEDVLDLVEDADLVVSGIDQPDGIDHVVNEACARAGLPWVRGGMSGANLIYFSVDFGEGSATPCFRCYTETLTDDAQKRTADRLDRVNRGCGPAAALVGSLVAFEALRYLTGFAPPAAAGATILLDTSDGCRQTRIDWPSDPDCPVCALARQRAVVA